MRQPGNDLQHLLASPFWISELRRVRRLVFHHRLNIVAPIVFLDFRKAAPRAQSAKRFLRHLLREEMCRGRAHERFLRLELRNQRLAGLRGIHTSVQKERRGIRIEIERVLRDVNDRIWKQQQPGGKRLNIHAALSQVESQRKIIGRVGLLKIGLHDHVFDQIQRLRRFIQLKKKRRGIKLKNVVGLLRRHPCSSCQSAFR